MSSARERREAISEERRSQRRDFLEDLLSNYEDVFEKISDVIIAHLNSSDSDEECSCDECSCSNEFCDPIGERVSKRALEAIEEVVARWTNDPDYDSDDAMDHICNVFEKLGR